MYGRRSSRGGAFSSVPGMLICPCLSAPPRLLPAPPALALEAAWYIANLTAHFCDVATREGHILWTGIIFQGRPSRSLLTIANRAFQPRHTRPCHSVSLTPQSPATGSLLPSHFDPTHAIYGGLRLARNRVPPNVQRHMRLHAAAPSPSPFPSDASFAFTTSCWRVIHNRVCT